jgi:hypothetical protein
MALLFRFEKLTIMTLYDNILFDSFSALSHERPIVPSRTSELINRPERSQQNTDNQEIKAKMRKALLTTALILTLAGCTKDKTQVADDKLHSLVIGKSTEPEILKTMGNPTSSTLNTSGNKTLVYSEEKRQKKQSGGENVQSKVLVLEIGTDGKLTGISRTESSIETSSDVK